MTTPDGSIGYTQAVDETGASAQQYTKELRDAFDHLMTVAKNVFGEGWEGEAQAMFQNAEREWDMQANALANAQTEIGRLTQVAAENAYAADRAGANLMP